MEIFEADSPNSSQEFFLSIVDIYIFAKATICSLCNPTAPRSSAARERDDIAGRVIVAKGFDAGDAILRAAIRDQVAA